MSAGEPGPPHPEAICVGEDAAQIAGDPQDILRIRVGGAGEIHRRFDGALGLTGSGDAEIEDIGGEPVADIAPAVPLIPLHHHAPLPQIQLPEGVPIRLKQRLCRREDQGGVGSDEHLDSER